MANVLAIDLGKLKSVACVFNSADGEYAFQTLPTGPTEFQDICTDNRFKKTRQSKST